MICPVCEKILSLEDFGVIIEAECMHESSVFTFIKFEDVAAEALQIKDFVISHRVKNNKIITCYYKLIDQNKYEKYLFIDGYLFDFRDKNIAEKVRKLLLLA